VAQYGIQEPLTRLIRRLKTPMPATLHQLLLAPETMPQVVTDCRGLVEQELSSKSGMSAAAVKAAYKVVTTFAPGYYQSVIEEMLPDMTDKLEPFWADFNASGGAEFGDYLAKRGGEVSEALLSVTDRTAEISQRPVLVKAYKAVRGGASKHIEAALPNLGALVQKYAVLRRTHGVVHGYPSHDTTIASATGVPVASRMPGGVSGKTASHYRGP
jgi:hypothetical protein